jgi:hypothetical protein
MTKTTILGIIAALFATSAAASFAWIASAPAMPFKEADFVKPGDPTVAERRAMYEHCLSIKPPHVSPTRQLSVCTCQMDRLARELTRAEYVYVLFLSRDETRLANSVLKGLAAAGRPQAEIASAGGRGAQAVRETISACLQNSLTPNDMARIRGRLEQLGIAPAAGTMSVDGER